jgi:ribonuclease HI
MSILIDNNCCKWYNVRMITPLNSWTINFDGACEPFNPGGTASYGFILYRNGLVVKEDHGIIGKGEGMTNNVAEHCALKEALTLFLSQIETEKGPHILTIYGDSKLVINQIVKKWKAKDGSYLPYYKENMRLMRELHKKGVQVNAQWIPREMNQKADDLSKLNKIEQNLLLPLTN